MDFPNRKDVLLCTSFFVVYEFSFVTIDESTGMTLLKMFENEESATGKFLEETL